MTFITDINGIAPKVGQGIFVSKDVAEILRLPLRKVRYSMRGFWQVYNFGEDNNKAINFQSLVEFFIFYQLREHKISAENQKGTYIDGKGLKYSVSFCPSSNKNR